MDNVAIAEIRTLFREIESRLTIILMTVPDIEKLNAPTDRMNAVQLAEYWQIVDAEGKARTGGILKWAKRPPDQFPLPHAYMGDLLRFHREDVNKWAKEEADRRRIQNQRKRLKTA